jgi:hypothetical protein
MPMFTVKKWLKKNKAKQNHAVESKNENYCSHFTAFGRKN